MQSFDSGLIRSSTAVDVRVDCRSVSADVDSVSELVVDVAVVETSQLL